MAPITKGVLLSVYIFALVITITFANVPSPKFSNDKRRICSRTESFDEDVTLSVQVSYTERYTPECSKWSKFWSWLTKNCNDRYRTSYRQEERLQTITRYKKVQECCSGWDPKTNCTTPLCKPACVHGLCVEPYTCQCYPGWTGGSCENACPKGNYGLGCSGNCSCMECDHITGDCQCPAGYIGEKCDQVCQGGWYGENCTSRCDQVCQGGWYGENCTSRCKYCGNGTCRHTDGLCVCDEGFSGSMCDRECGIEDTSTNCGNIDCGCAEGQGECNPFTGKCLCFPGFRGDSCEVLCPSGMHGVDCKMQCNCSNNAKCDPRTGKCQCLRGWSGERCSVPCQLGTYGLDCKERCPCEHFSSCSAITGECTCAEGYKGDHCDIECASGSFGPGCKEECLCKNDADCNHVTGFCNCTSGWMGKHCDQPCPEFTYGFGCSHQCDCSHGASCDRINGECKCTAGWRGDKCEMPCEESFYGLGCLQPCNCIGTDICDAVSGRCICNGSRGINCSLECEALTFGLDCQEPCECFPNNTESCDNVNGKCTCTNRFHGIHCTECGLGYYGANCDFTCDCGSAFCDRLVGACICPDGYFGKNCNESCWPGAYGKQCSLSCECANSAVCDPVDGSCTCEPGWTGKICNEECPAGRYGPDCAFACRCKNGAQCHPVTGWCNCTAGWEGDTCEVAELVAGADDEGSDFLPILIGCVVGVVFFLLILLAVLVVRWRRKQRSGADIELKTRCVHNGDVHYVGNSSSPPRRPPPRTYRRPTEAEYNFQNPNYDQNRIVNNRSSSSTTRTGTAASGMNPIYYHSSSKSTGSPVESDSDSTEQTPLTRVDINAPVMVNNPLADAGADLPPTEGNDSPTSDNVYEYIAPQEEPEGLTVQRCNSNLNNVRSAVGDKGEDLIVVARNEPTQDVVYADIEDETKNSEDYPDDVELSASGGQYDTIDRSRKFTRPAAEVPSSPPSIYGRLSSGIDTASSVRSNSDASEPVSSPSRLHDSLTDGNNPPSVLENEYCELDLPEEPVPRRDAAKTVSVGKSTFFDGSDNEDVPLQPSSTYEYIAVNEQKPRRKPPLPRPRKEIPKHEISDVDQHSGKQSSVPRPRPRKLVPGKPTSPKTSSKPRRVQRSPPNSPLPPRPDEYLNSNAEDDNLRPQSNIYSEISDNIGRPISLLSSVSDRSDASRFSQSSSGSGSQSPRSRISTRSMNSLTEGQLTGKYPPPRIPDKERSKTPENPDASGNRISTASDDSVYDIPRTSFLTDAMAGDSSSNFDGDSSSDGRTNGDIQQKSQLENIPENTQLCDSGVNHNIHDEPNAADMFSNPNDSYGIYENSLTSLSGELYDTPRSFKSSVTRM